MVPAQKHFGRLPAPEIRGPRVLGTIQESRIAEGFLEGGILIAENAGQEPGNAIYHYCRRQLTAARSEIADGKLLVGQMLGHSLIDALIATADQEQLVELSRQPARGFRSEERRVGE